MVIAHDQLGKVQPLINHLSNKFAEVYEPSREVAVDETMIKFQGRSSLKQYMPMKPIKHGIKVWVLGDSTVTLLVGERVKSGFLLAFYQQSTLYFAQLNCKDKSMRLTYTLFMCSQKSGE